MASVSQKADDSATVVAGDKDEQATTSVALKQSSNSPDSNKQSRIVGSSGADEPHKEGSDLPVDTDPKIDEEINNAVERIDSITKRLNKVLKKSAQDILGIGEVFYNLNNLSVWKAKGFKSLKEWLESEKNPFDIGYQQARKYMNVYSWKDDVEKYVKDLGPDALITLDKLLKYTLKKKKEKNVQEGNQVDNLSDITTKQIPINNNFVIDIPDLEEKTKALKKAIKREQDKADNYSTALKKAISDDPVIQSFNQKMEEREEEIKQEFLDNIKEESFSLSEMEEKLIVLESTGSLLKEFKTGPLKEKVTEIKNALEYSEMVS